MFFCCLSNRRKTINNNLSNYLNDKDKASRVLKDLGIPDSKRPEDLSPETFVRIFNQLKKY